MEQGKLSLTDRVFPLLGIKPYPEDSQADPRLDKITIEQCLKMTGGWSSSCQNFTRLPKKEVNNGGEARVHCNGLPP